MYDMIAIVTGIPEGYSDLLVIITGLITVLLTFFAVDLLINGIFGKFNLRERRKR